ncbi:MAG: hypothetical protein ABJE66_25085 [Deltaproteobacteria bacterium]
MRDPIDPLLPLDELLAASSLSAGRGTLAVPETWQQGRGAFGGFVTGAMVHALEVVRRVGHCAA